MVKRLRNSLLRSLLFVFISQSILLYLHNMNKTKTKYGWFIDRYVAMDKIDQLKIIFDRDKTHVLRKNVQFGKVPDDSDGTFANHSETVWYGYTSFAGTNLEKIDIKDLFKISTHPELKILEQNWNSNKIQ